METYYVDVDCIGTITGKVYHGKFEIKLHLSLKEMAAVKRETNRVTQGLTKTPMWDFPGFVKGLKDEIEGMDEDAKLNLSESQRERICRLAVVAIPLGDPEADIMSSIAELNMHIVGDVPEWWGRTKDDLGGYCLQDWQPAVELQKGIQELRSKLASPKS